MNIRMIVSIIASVGRPCDPRVVDQSIWQRAATGDLHVRMLSTSRRDAMSSGA